MSAIKDIRLRVSNIINKLNYNQIKLKSLDSLAVKFWCYKHLPKAVEAFKRHRFDFDNPHTWEEIAAYNVILKMYGKKVAIYFTYSWLHFQDVKDFIQSKRGGLFRKDFGIDCHSAILLSPEIFFKAEALDEFWVNFDFEKGYSFLDYSHYNDDDDVDLEEYQWLNEISDEQENIEK